MSTSYFIVSSPFGRLLPWKRPSLLSWSVYLRLLPPHVHLYIYSKWRVSRKLTRPHSPNERSSRISMARPLLPRTFGIWNIVTAPCGVGSRVRTTKGCLMRRSCFVANLRNNIRRLYVRGSKRFLCEISWANVREFRWDRRGAGCVRGGWVVAARGGEGGDGRGGGKGVNLNAKSPVTRRSD